MPARGERPGMGGESRAARGLLMTGAMRKAWLSGVAIAIVVGCGGKVVPDPTPGPIDISACYECPQHPAPQPAPRPAPAPKPAPTFGDDDAGDPPPPPPPPPPPLVDAGIVPRPPARNATTYPCQPGAQVKMTYTLSPFQTDDGGEATCEGVVAFSDDGALETGVMEDPDGGGIVHFSYNGASICTSPPRPDHPHCSDLEYSDGTITPQYCTIFARCENGLARAVGFTW